MLLKPVVATLRQLGIRLILYLNDMLILSRTKEEARQHLATILKLLVSLGFIVNLDKSVTEPTQVLGFLGFKLNSRLMTISLPGHKLHDLKKLARRMMKRETTSVQEIAQLLGTMVATHPPILPTPLYYRNLESARSRAGLTYEAEWK